jgi:hypothetical protein
MQNTANLGDAADEALSPPGDLTDADRRRVQAYVMLVGVDHAARAIGCARESLLRLIAGQPVRRGTELLFVRASEKLARTMPMGGSRTP